MKPKLARRAIDQLDQAIADLAALRPLFLDILARDEQSADPERFLTRIPNDPVHRATTGLCNNVSILSYSAARSVTIAKTVVLAIPKQQSVSVPVCRACHDPSKPIHGGQLCRSCYDTMRYETRRTGQDRQAWIIDRERSTFPLGVISQ